MKKYITLAALLAAGTTFANAETITTTFTGALEADSVDAVGLVVTGIPGITGTVESLTTIDNGTELGLRTVTSETDGTFFAPSTNVGTADGWVAEFSYSFTGKTLEVTSVTLDVGIFSAGNGWQGNDTNRDFTFAVTFGDKKVSSGNVTVRGNTTSVPGNGAITLTFAEAVTLTDSANLVVEVDKGTSNPGCFLGLHDIKVDAVVVPEPSAFGMLAGLGALALVAARRRRK